MRLRKTNAAISAVAVLAGLAGTASGAASATESAPAPHQVDQGAQAAPAGCAFIQDQDKRWRGTHVNQYWVHIAWVRNNCATPQTLTIDAQWYPDPPCITIQPGTTGRIDYVVDASLPPGVGDPQGLTTAC